MGELLLKSMQCPCCNGPIKVENPNESVECVYCGNIIMPIEKNSSDDNDKNINIVRIDGIETASSALAYIEQYFEDYDWTTFSYVQTLSVEEINHLADKLKVTSADKKETWFVCFQSVYVPFAKKIEGCDGILKKAINEYKKDNLESYSTFDAYRRIVSSILINLESVYAKVNGFIDKAEKYGATPAEVKSMRDGVSATFDNIYLKQYAKLEDVEEIKLYDAEKKEQVVAKLAAQGVNAETAYSYAKGLIEEGRSVEALNALIPISEYLDSNKLISKIDKYFLVSDYLEIDGKAYYYYKNMVKSGGVDISALALHRTNNGAIEEKPMVKNILNIITNYANILYYIDTNYRVAKLDLNTGASENLGKATYLKDQMVVANGGRKVFLLTKGGTRTFELHELNLATAQIRTIVTNAVDTVYIKDDYLVYTTEETEKSTNVKTKSTCICRVDTITGTILNGIDARVCGFIDESAVYTVKTPNDKNKSLYIKSLKDDSAEILLEDNIYDFSDILDGYIYYSVGNARRKSLIRIKPDGTDRHELPLYMNEAIMEQGGWVYFLRSIGYNTILCKSKADGSSFKIIAREIDKFIEIKNGYLYYIDSNQTLVKVRMDGTNSQELCDNVERVLSIRDDKVVFMTTDEISKSTFNYVTKTTVVKSIYAVDFSGYGKKKLVYNVSDAKECDDSTFYYIVADSTNPDYGKKNYYRYNMDTGESELLLKASKTAPVKSGGCYVATAVYGSYDCPQVWTLRRFRDDDLASTWYGRAFIHTYYAISPTLVKWFGDTNWFKNMWRGTLDRMVNSLQEKGYESTPYEDRNW